MSKHICINDETGDFVRTSTIYSVYVSSGKSIILLRGGVELNSPLTPTEIWARVYTTK